jgi:hypothetical protein
MQAPISAALSAALVLTITAPADAGQMASKRWTEKVIDRELLQAERRIERRLGQRFNGLAAASLAEPLHAVLPTNTELTLAHVGDDLAIVALCMMDGVADTWAGAFIITTGPDFAVTADNGDQVGANALGFFVRWTAGIDHPSRPGTLIVTSEFSDSYGLTGRIATAPSGETFFFDPWTVIYDSDDACEVTAPVTFGTNGSDIVFFPEGEDPVPLPTQDGGGFDYVSGDLVGSWKAERFPWVPG